MTNRLIGLIIILFFIILGFFYFYGVKKNDQIIENKSEKQINNNKVIKYKKATLTLLIDKENKNNLLSLTKEEKKELENHIILKIQKKISNILKINNLDKINISRILGTENLFLVNILNNNFHNISYIYNNKTSNIKKIDLNINIIYAKINNSKINLITKKGTFILENNKLNYFSTFSDFIINKGNYIGIIKAEDKIIKNNFNYSEENGDLIVLYNPKESIKRILYKPNFKIKNIYSEDKKIIITDSNEKKYLLDY